MISNTPCCTGATVCYMTPLLDLPPYYSKDFFNTIKMWQRILPLTLWTWRSAGERNHNGDNWWWRKNVVKALPNREKRTRVWLETSKTPQASSMLRTYKPASYECHKNKEAGLFLLQLSRVYDWYDFSQTQEKSLKIQIHWEPLYELSLALMLWTNLEYIWNNRLQKKNTSLLGWNAFISS